MIFRRIESAVTSFILYGFALLLGVLGTYYWFNSSFFAPVDRNATQQRSFIVERGWSLKAISNELEKQGFVRKGWAFQFLGKVKGSKVVENGKSKIKAGEYALKASLTPLQILDKFINEEILYHDALIPEGKTVNEIADILAATTLTSKSEALAALNSQVLMQKLQIPAQSLEGYLFPSLYKFTRPDNAEIMVTRMAQEMKNRLTPEIAGRAIDLGYSTNKILILASIIEKETGNPAERKLISSVFHNRLKLNMPLQSDPTVIYGIPNFDGNLKKSDLTNPGPYNTYINRGLPPTPICNPGMDSINAALFPEETDYIYFVAKGDGTSHFSTTYKEHQEAVRKYQVRPNT